MSTHPARKADFLADPKSSRHFPLWDSRDFDAFSEGLLGQTQHQGPQVLGRLFLLTNGTKPGLSGYPFFLTQSADDFRSARS